MPQIREQIAMVHLPPSKTLKYLFHVRKTDLRSAICGRSFFILNLDFCGQRVSISLVPHAWLRLDAICAGLFLRNFYCRIQPMVKNYFLASVG